ncbi:uncharacterized protein [Phaseolus vulgaris]|uniref:uncharacterized protein n=1 Tax=Phaseolus vulgaris TaxID=3885 RepID=UPI0035C9D257
MASFVKTLHKDIKMRIEKKVGKSPEFVVDSLQLGEYDGDQDQEEIEANNQGQEEVESQVEDAQEVISPPHRLTRSKFKELGNSGRLHRVLRVENALKDELRSVRDDKNELRRKLHDKLQEIIELESKLVPLREKIAKLEEANRTGGQPREEIDREGDFLGRVEQDRDKASQELAETAEELAQAREETAG